MASLSLRTIAFGDLETCIWGAIWDLGEGQPSFALFADGTASPVHARSPRIDGSEQTETWTLSAPGIELECSGESDAGVVPHGFDQLIRIRGNLRQNDSELEIDCLGRRGVRDDFDLSGLETVRDVSAWFEPDLGLAVVAARPRGNASHADDHLSASLFEEGHSLAVADPRLSTTYTKSGVPTRASLELWLEKPAADDGGSERDKGEEPFPRRAAGEAVGAGATVAEGFLHAHAQLFQWHARGREGAGVYVLGRLDSE